MVVLPARQPVSRPVRPCYVIVNFYAPVRDYELGLRKQMVSISIAINTEKLESPELQYRREEKEPFKGTVT
jgi:hypothetical protein